MENSIYYAFVTLGTSIFCIGIVLFLKKPFERLSTSAVKQLDTILNTSLDEKDKDKLILKNLSKLLVDFITVILILPLTIFLGTIPVLVYVTYKPEIYIDTSTIYFYLSMISGSFCLLLFKKPKNSDYNYWSKLLHTIILDNYNLGKYLLNGQLKNNNEGQSGKSSFVIVTGLARAGTTALTKLLYNPDIFHSINYANIPFLMAPNLWKKVYNPKSSKEKERPHGDNVLFSKNSIEALEEYFFKVTLNDKYIHADYLSIHEIDSKVYSNYRGYQNLFKEEMNSTTTYLAKNNNFILRYESMRKLDKHFNLVVVFRDPLEHAGSLLSQHKNFLLRQNDDDFVLKYMNWLGHHEFGLNQKYFELCDEKIWKAFDKDSLNYWIAIWINYYSYILQLPDDPKLFLVHYDDLATNPSELKHKLSDCFDINLEHKCIEPYKNNKSHVIDLDNIDDKLLNSATGIYEKLKANKIMIKSN